MIRYFFNCDKYYTMPGKDRLQELLKVANACNNGNVAVTIQNHENTANIQKTRERTELINSWIEKVEKNIQQIKAILLKNNDINVNRKELFNKLQDLFQNNTSIGLKISEKLKEFEQELQKLDPASAEGRIKTIQYNSSKIRYQKAFTSNAAELENYKSSQRNLIKAQLQVKGVIVSDEDIQSILDEGKDIQIFTDNIIAQTAEERRILADVEERHEELLKIERMLTEVRDLFLELSILVEHQQELVDRVEYQANMATAYISRVDLSKPLKQKRRNCKIKLILISVVTVVLLIIITSLFV